MQWSLWFAGLMNTGPDDRIYNCLPMYHSIGGVTATGALLVRGGSVVIGEKFSASTFWDDVVNWDCTLFQYIGELCRYLVNAPQHPRERQHRLRLCCGNGLRADTWEKFQSRFEIPRILEFYAATEGNVSLYNVEGKVGAIGRVPPFLAHRFPLALVQFDAVSGEPARDKDGRAIRCTTDEVGEAIGRIGRGTAEAGGGEFEGYTSAADSERKILRDVFEPGDAWYRTGDLMRMDGAGFYYFVDRIGDTFRWKGENVATSEVAAVLMDFPGIAEATVYGVAVPGTEGAAGMAPLVADGALDFAATAARIWRGCCPLMRGRCFCESSTTSRRRRRSSPRPTSLSARASISPWSATKSTSTTRSAKPMCRSTPRSTSASRPGKSGFRARSQNSPDIACGKLSRCATLRETVNAYGRLRGNRAPCAALNRSAMRSQRSPAPRHTGTLRYGRTT